MNRDFHQSIFTPDNYTPRVSRRAVLRGLGATLVLPWLESVAWATPAATPGIEGPPRRFAAIAFGNGVWPKDWWAKGEGPAMEFGKTLSPLATVRDDVIVLDGLRQDEKLAMRHGYYFTAFLSGGNPQRESISSAITVDQVLAQEFGQHTIVPSLALGIEPVRPGIVNGAPSVYQASISWSAPSTPVPIEVSPRLAFDRLFDIQSLKADQSVLDYVLGQSKSLRTRLAPYDREKLDQYMDSIREIEKRIAMATSDAPKTGWQPTLKQPDLPRPGETLPEDRREHMKLMMDILVLGFQMDKTRIASLVLHQDFSDMTFEFLDGVAKSGVHGISHHQDNLKNIVQYQIINQFHVEMFTYLIQRMKQVKEGEGTLLDHSMLMFGSSLMDGNSHDVDRVPLVLAGRGGGTLRTGRALSYEKDEDRRLCNLHLSILHYMGLKTDKFGNSTKPLPGLL